MDMFVIDAVDGYSNDDLTSVDGTKRKSSPVQSEALRAGPTNACGSPHIRNADHVAKRDPRGADNKRRKHGA